MRRHGRPLGVYLDIVHHMRNLGLTGSFIETMKRVPANSGRYRRLYQVLNQRPGDAARWGFSTARWLFDRKSRKFPRTVGIEPTNHCNLTCPSCPQAALSNSDQGYMDIELFRKVVDESRRHSSMADMVFTGCGEPFLHPELIAMSRYAKDSGIPLVRTYTNCTLLDEKVTDDILIRSGFDEMTLSINADNPVDYERIKDHWDYDEVIANVFHFLERRQSRRKKTPFVNLQLLKTPGHAPDEHRFLAEWQPLLGKADSVVLYDSHSFAGQVSDNWVQNESAASERQPCGQLWNFVLVSWNGNVSPCCVDYFDRLKIGTVTETPLETLWHSHELRTMRELHASKQQGQMPLCKDCGLWSFYNSAIKSKPGGREP